MPMTKVKWSCLDVEEGEDDFKEEPDEEEDPECSWFEEVCEEEHHIRSHFGSRRLGSVSRQKVTLLQ